MRGTHVIRRVLRRPIVLDAMLVPLVLWLELTAAHLTFPVGDPDRGLAMLVLGAGALPLVVRRRFPVTVALVTVGLDVTQTVLGFGDPSTLPSVIGLYSLGRHAAGVPVWSVAGATIAAYSVLYRVYSPDIPGQVSLSIIGPLLIIGVGAFFRLRSDLRVRRQRQLAEDAVRAERRRIARELHDVVAHHISVINVLVGAGRTTMATDPERAQEALLGAERTAREAMTEMRQLLHVLRAEGEEPESNAGVGAAALPDLVTQANNAGLPTRLEVVGEAVPLPAAVDHAVYRIVQEALTNTRKHAGDAWAKIRLVYLPGQVEVEVLDDGPARGGDGRARRSGRRAPGTGFGLEGMAERVALCGGELHTGPRSGGGFKVHARIPVPAPEAATPEEVR